ncbi:hypothetical protein D3C78_967580 [compost metagenome]
MFDATERRDLVGDQPGVDPDHAVFQLLGDLEHPGDIAAVEVRGQAVLGGVGQRNDFFVAVEAHQRRHRAEDFFFQQLHARADIGQHGRLEEVATQHMGLTAEYPFSAFADSVVDQAANFGHCFVADQRTDLRAFGAAMANAQLAHAFDEALAELRIDAVMDIEAVDAHAGLASVTVFGHQRAFDSRIDVGVVEHNERCIAAQFQADFLDGFGALAHQQAAHRGRAGEAQLTYRRMAGELRTNGRGITGHHTEHAGRHASALGQFNQGQGAEGCFVGGFDHHGAASGQGRGDLAGDHRRREVPRRDGGTHADALLDHQQAFVIGRARDYIAVDAFAFFGEPFDKGGGVTDFAQGFVQRFALFEGHQLGQVVFVFEQQFEPAAQDLCAVLGGAGAPVGQGHFGGFDGTFGFGAAHQGHMAEQLAVGRVGYRQATAIVGVAPAPGNVGLLAQQRIVIEFHARYSEARRTAKGRRRRVISRRGGRRRSGCGSGRCRVRSCRCARGRP